jgi:hypothetical protein
MDEYDYLFAQLEAATKEKDEYIKQLENRILLLEGRLKEFTRSSGAACYDHNKATPEPGRRVRFEKEELTRSHINEYYRGKITYTQLISRTNPKH